MWQEVLNLLKSDVALGEYTLFIHPLTVVKNTDKEIILECPSISIMNKVEKSYKGFIESRIKEITNAELKAKFQVAYQPVTEKKKEKKDFVNFSVNETTEFTILESALSAKYDFRRDTISGLIEYKKKNETEFRQWSEIIFNDVYKELLTNPKLKDVHPSTIRISLNSSFVRNYNPLIEYIQSFNGKWKKGDKDYLSEMVNCFKYTNKIDVAHYFKKWYTMAIHSVFVPNFINEYCFLIQSDRGGKGKTIFCTNFAPAFIRAKYQNSARYVEFKSKDSLQLASTCMFWDLDEFEGIASNRFEADQLRGFISNTGAIARRAYGKDPERFNRTVSFLGSCNVEEPLWDTENRRFIVVTVEEKLKFDKFLRINKEMVLAQVYNEYLELEGNEILLSPKEENEIIDNARQYERNHNEYDVIGRHFEPAGKESESAKWLTASKVLEFLSTNHPKLSFNINGIGRALSKAGFSKNKNNTYRSHLIGFKSREAFEYFKADKADKADFSKLN